MTAETRPVVTDSETVVPANGGSGDASRRLRIGIVAPLWLSVPPATYGGTELFVHLLAEGLVQRGHDVTLFASGDSKTAGRLHSVYESGLYSAMGRGQAWEHEHYTSAILSEALFASGGFDVLHCNLGCSLIPFSRLSKAPVVHTLHTTLSIDDRWVVNRYPDIPIVGISNYQVGDVEANRQATTRVIHHGCDFDSLRPAFSHSGYLLFLARMGAQKSPLDAIRIARAAGMPLVLAGKPQNATEVDYFERLIKPEIDGRLVTYVGSADHQQKNDLLRDAAALLFPIEGGEAFGLAMIEAMACGTPVLAFGRASVPEIVDYGITGYYADSPEELAGLVPAAVALDRRRVREHAYRRFSHDRMVDEYVEFYRSIIAARETVPVAAVKA